MKPVVDDPAPEAERPSTKTDGYWIYAADPRRRDRPMSAGGKWMVHVDRDEIDPLWDRVAAAVRSGALGRSAKVSTALPNPNSRNPNKHVICVYTDDADDESEIRRVRAELRTLGVTWKIGYKTNAATRARIYEKRGAKRISKYWE